MKYEEIVETLGLDAAADRKSAKLLDGMVEEPETAQLRTILSGACVIVFGAGPSLRTDMVGVKEAGLHRSCVLIAAGGAIKAFTDAGIIPQVHVTDLDGDEHATAEANKKGTTTVVHAHGDNISLIKKQVPHLRGVIGTTQVAAFGKLQNFGGFSDGDRAAHIADHYGAAIIALAGMDFGTVIGKYSGSRDPAFTRKKLAIGKKLLENLAEKTDCRIVNLTEKGEPLAGIPRVTVEELKSIAGQLR